MNTTTTCNHIKCKKSIEMMKFTCKCRENFCIKHKNPQSHNCQFDYKNDQKKILEKNIVKIVKRKVEEI